MRYLVVVVMMGLAACEGRPLESFDDQEPCGSIGQKCCLAATPADVSLVPMGVNEPQGIGSCAADGAYCKDSACPPRSSCADGSYNFSTNVEYGIAVCSAVRS
jgi:hypothetical protein